MVRKKIGVVMETIQEKIEKSFKENSPRIAIKKGEKNTTYSELYNEVKILSFNISNVWPEQRKYLLVWLIRRGVELWRNSAPVTLKTFILRYFQMHQYLLLLRDPEQSRRLERE